MLALRPDQVVFYYHQDQLGSTRALTDRAGAVVATYTYDPYGNLTASTGTVTTPFGYAGQYTDAESGLIYLRVRYYDPSTAQFLTVDPAYAQTQSRYGYVDGDPLNLMDPSGETPLVLYDIDRPAFSEPAAEADLYWKVWAAGGSPIFHPTTWLDSYGRIPDLQWSSPFGGSTIAEVKAGNGGTAGSDVIAQAEADAAIRDAGCVDSVVWHFYPGLGKYNGPSPQLVSILDGLGINIVIHRYREPESQKSPSLWKRFLHLAPSLIS